MPLPEEKDARVILEQSNMAPDKPVKEDEPVKEQETQGRVLIKMGIYEDFGIYEDTLPDGNKAYSLVIVNNVNRQPTTMHLSSTKADALQLLDVLDRVVDSVVN